ALTTAGAVKCWGYNLFGQLGDGSISDSTTPVDVTGLSSGVAQIATGTRHTCALTTAGGVKCWGQNTYGQLGNGSTADSATPVDATGLPSGVAQIPSTTYLPSALTTAGAVKCWGYNPNGQLGNGSTSNSATPVDV